MLGTIRIPATQNLVFNRFDPWIILRRNQQNLQIKKICLFENKQHIKARFVEEHLLRFYAMLIILNASQFWTVSSVDTGSNLNGVA